MDVGMGGYVLFLEGKQTGLGVRCWSSMRKRLGTRLKALVNNMENLLKVFPLPTRLPRSVNDVNTIRVFGSFYDI
jgi:hypothetical protein